MNRDFKLTRITELLRARVNLGLEYIDEIVIIDFSAASVSFI